MTKELDIKIPSFWKSIDKEKLTIVTEFSTMEWNRLLTPEIEKEAVAFGLPIAMSDFSDGCPDYIPNEVKE
jgi:hypothetical protein